MKRLAVGVVVLLVSGFAAVFFWKEARKPAVIGANEQPRLSEQKKAEIRTFWDVYHRAMDLRLAGDWESELAALREALAIDPRHEGALYYQGNALFELRRYDEAIASWRRLVEANPLSARAHFQLGSVYSCGEEGAPFDLDTAETEFRRALAINKEETGPIVGLGEIALLKGQYDQALNYFTTALASNFKSVEAYYLTGYIRWRSGTKETALEALRDAVKYSHATPSGEPLREGDTRRESGQGLPERTSRKSFFEENWEALATWDPADVSARQMEDEYGNLDRHLKSLPSSARAR